MIEQIRHSIETIAGNAVIRDEDRFIERAEALETLEFPILSTLETLAGKPDPAIEALLARAQTLQHDLQAIDRRLFRHLRTLLQSAALSPGERLRLLRRYDNHQDAESRQAELHYDYLDTLVDGVLGIEPPPTDTANEPLAPDMVAYQPTPARVILDLVEYGGITRSDRFYDLGSGLGHVGLLTAMLTGATTIGVEIDGAQCMAARRSATRLGLPNATFLHADARDADYSAGTAFYLYTPFTGAVLETVLEQLRQVSANHPIRVYAYGPHLATLATRTWLHPIKPPDACASPLLFYTAPPCRRM